MHATDEDLAAQAIHNREAFAELYRRYVQWIHAYCYRRLGNHQAAEDATSQVFLRMLTAIESFTPRPSFRAWIFTLASNICIDLQRRTKRIAFEPLGETWDGPSDDPGPEDLAIAGEFAMSLRDLMSVLTADQQRVIELRLAELTGPEIQAVLGRSRAWVNTTQHRALKALRLAAQSRMETIHDR